MDRQQRVGDQIGDEQSRLVGRIAEHVLKVIGRQTALTELVECGERRGGLELSTQPGDGVAVLTLNSVRSRVTIGSLGGLGGFLRLERRRRRDSNLRGGFRCPIL